MNNAKPPEAASIWGDNLTDRQYMAWRALRWGAIPILLLIAGGLAAATSYPLASRSPTATSPVDARLPVQVLVTQRVKSFDRALHHAGVIAARRTSELGFERSARVISIMVDEGHLVDAGQALAVLDTRQLETKRRELTAERTEAAALLEELRTGPRRQTIAEAEAVFSDLSAQVRMQTRHHDRIQMLVDRNAATRQQLDDAVFTLQSVVARRDAAAERLSELREGTRPEKIAAQQAVVDQLDAQLEGLQVDIEDSTLHAPFTGRISARHLDEGTVAAVGQPVLRLVEHNALEARVGLPVDAAARLSVGEQVPLMVNGRRIPATVERLLPEVDLATRTRLVVFLLHPAAAESVVPGQIVRVELAASTPTDGFWIPTSALKPSTRGLWSVHVVVDGTVEQRTVEVLHTAAEKVLVRGTLNEGDHVVASGAQRIVPGQQVISTKSVR